MTPDHVGGSNQCQEPVFEAIPSGRPEALSVPIPLDLHAILGVKNGTESGSTPCLLLKGPQTGWMAGKARVLLGKGLRHKDHPSPAPGLPLAPSVGTGTTGDGAVGGQ